MTTVFRNALLMMLAMLQLVAPLVHAHAGNFKSSEGIHLPGFESYASTQHAVVVKKVNLNHGAEGLLVVMDAGIKDPQDATIETKDIGYALPVTLIVLVASLHHADSNFSPHKRSFSYRIQPSPISPRAPPAY
jgi:hypothetical protein